MGLSLKKPSSRAAEKLRTETKRIVADVPDSVHRSLRIVCLERGVSVRDFLIELLKGAGIQ